MSRIATLDAFVKKKMRYMAYHVRIYCKLLTQEKEFMEFKNHYLDASGSSLPLEYFSGRKVYGFYHKSKMISGFIIGTLKPFRTIDVFVNEAETTKVYHLINNGENCCEVCGFWMTKKSYTLWRSVYIWFSMTSGIWNSGKDFYIGGTKAFGLAKIYGCPKHSDLIYTGEVKGKQTWVFKAVRQYVYFSFIEVIIYKLKKMVNKIILKKSTDVVFKVSKII